jgi:hypothetical protein
MKAVYQMKDRCYASVMEYLRPEKVLSKDRTLKAYPIGGEVCIAVDAYMNYHKHRHRASVIFELLGLVFG